MKIILVEERIDEREINFDLEINFCKGSEFSLQLLQ